MRLVVLKEALSVTKDSTTFKPNYHYRHIDFKNGVHVVNGEDFTDTEFNSLFESAIDRVKNHWKEIGILGENNKPISKSLFTKLADIHIFGYGTRAMKVWYFSNRRGCIYGFYPMQGTKIENQKECYQYYLDILNGNYDPLDEQNVCFGNSGYPLSYTRLRIS
jgi:hypothetical protein